MSVLMKTLPLCSQRQTVTVKSRWKHTICRSCKILSRNWNIIDVDEECLWRWKVIWNFPEGNFIQKLIIKFNVNVLYKFDFIIIIIIIIIVVVIISVCIISWSNTKSVCSELFGHDAKSRMASLFMKEFLHSLKASLVHTYTCKFRGRGVVGHFSLPLGRAVNLT